MARAKELFERVLDIQRQLGTGEAEEALAAAPSLRTKSAELLRKGALLTSFDRAHAAAAYTYATVTLILALAEVREPKEFVPRIREAASEVVQIYRPGSEMWKALAAAAEMLARAGDTEGAVWAIKKARQLNPGEDELVKLGGSIRSMYPGVYAQAPDDVPDEPPALEAPGR